MRQGVLVNLLFLVCLVAGGLSVRRIAVDAYPNVDLDAAAIYTVWIGASPEEVDTLITSKIEDELEGIRGIDRVVSESRPNRSSIVIKFKENLSDDDVDRAFQDIRSELDRIDDLPEDAEKPLLRRQTIFEIFPLTTVAVSFDDPELEAEARRVARDLREQLLTIDGVAKIDDRNLRDPEFTILVDRARMDRYDITFEEVAALLEATNRNVPAGEIRLRGGAEVAVKAKGNYIDARDISETIIRQDAGGGHVRVRDIARVVAGFEERDTKSRYNGADAILLPVAKDEGRNSLDLVDAVRAALKEFKSGGLPPGIKAGIALDSSQIIRDRLTILLTNLASGIVLVFIALWAAIGIRNAGLAIIGIPFCYLFALLFMDAMGISVNAISLFAMLLVSGVIVDDALIVLENIYRHMEAGSPRKEAIVRGLQEVFWPVTTSALTTMAAFLPMLLMVGVIGEFFSIIPQVIVVTLLASLFECFVILPVHFFDFGMRRKGKPMSDRRGWGIRVSGRIGPALRARYDRVLDVVLRHRYAALAVLLAVAFLTQAVWKRLDTVLFPSDFQVFIVDTEMPADASLEQTADASRAIDAVLERVRSKGPFAGKIDNWTTSSGAQFTEDNIMVVAPNICQAFVSLKQGTGVDPVSIRDYTMRLLEQIRDRPSGAEEERLAAVLRRFSKITALAQQDGPPTGKPVAVRVRCDDLNL
ncbi:MAG: efflux RND transporter permease subunit, partial [Planctomycetota bacterium]|nr:efflux RND transporter permease subunit [Planctomycetota bacterium]